jgi:hypothetical protein
MGSTRRALWVPVVLATLMVAPVATGAGSAVAAVAGRSPANPEPAAALTLSVAPSPQIEVGTGVGPLSEVDAVVSVSGPTFAGREVKVDSPQLQAACSGSFDFETMQGGKVSSPLSGTTLSVDLDGAGQADLVVRGSTCVPGTDEVEAKLVKAPHRGASTDLVVEPPATSSPGLTVSPDPEVETSENDVYAVFSVEMPPSEAGDTVEASDSQLDSDCGSWRYEANNGNAVFVFEGDNCLAGSSVVFVNLIEGPYTTDEEELTTTAEAPTISSFSPAKGPPGQMVSISGSSLLASPPPTVTFGGVAATVTNDTSSEITTTVPTGALTGRIEVTTPGGSATSAKKFRVS